MKKSMLAALITFLALFAFSADLKAQSAEISLAGYKQVPPVRTPGTGVVTVTVESDSLFVEGRFHDLRGVYRSAAVHYGSERDTGNRIFMLRSDVDEDYKGGELHRERNGFELRPSIREALSEGNLYIVIASDRFQRGEMRGQIPAMRE